jgi:hypothetical protein
VNIRAPTEADAPLSVPPASESLFCVAVSPGRLNGLDVLISMNLIRLSAWHALLANAARSPAEIARASLETVRRP